ncbi:MAG: FmdB family transcriptional regulator [Proteobacteria bacterium]|nr:MAG: FmdB family transcriptional regulator [Pseudomonadota bacterium]
MPIYEYQCRACGHELDKLQKFSDPPLTLCPACNQEALQKLISQSSFHLKGSGWYVTDYKRGGGANGSSSKPGGGTKGAGAETKSDAKGAATSPS